MQQITSQAQNSKWERINLEYESIKNTQTGKGINMSELASKLDVSTKTIQRDLEILRKYGVCKSGQKLILKESLKEDNLKNDERIVLGILNEMAKNNGSVFHKKANSLLKQITQRLEHPIFTHMNNESLQSENLDIFETLENAIESKNIIKCTYDKGGTSSVFELKPLKLAFFNGFWYLLVLDIHKNDKFKKLHLKSIESLEVYEHKFKLKSNIEDRIKNANSIWFDLDIEPFDVHILLDKEIVKYFKRKPLNSQRILGENNDGSMEILISITHEMEILPLVFAYIPLIKVMSPNKISKKIKNTIKEYLNQIS